MTTMNNKTEELGDKVVRTTTEILTEMEHDIDEIIRSNEKSGLEKYPLFFTILVAFGFIITIYSFEKIADQIPFIADNPYLMLAVGLGILIFTGTLYRKLQ